jgi:hypothetical protein
MPTWNIVMEKPTLEITEKKQINDVINCQIDQPLICELKNTNKRGRKPKNRIAQYGMKSSKKETSVCRECQWRGGHHNFNCKKRIEENDMINKAKHKKIKKNKDKTEEDKLFLAMLENMENNKVPLDSIDNNIVKKGVTGIENLATTTDFLDSQEVAVVSCFLCGDNRLNIREYWPIELGDNTGYSARSIQATWKEFFITPIEKRAIWIGTAHIPLHFISIRLIREENHHTVTASIYDSLDGIDNTVRDRIEKILKALCGSSHHIVIQITGNKWQKDSCNCGIYAAFTSHYLLKNGLRFQPPGKDVIAALRLVGKMATAYDLSEDINYTKAQEELNKHEEGLTKIGFMPLQAWKLICDMWKIEFVPLINENPSKQ